MTIDIHNPNTAAMHGVTFSDPLPGGVIFAQPDNLSSSGCGVNAVVAGNTLKLTNGTIAVGAVDCIIKVTVSGITASAVPYNNQITVTSVNVPTGMSNTATLLVNSGIGNGNGKPPQIAKAFSPNSINAGGVSTLNFDITNPNASVDIFGLQFSDTLMGMVIADDGPGHTSKSP